MKRIVALSLVLFTAGIHAEMVVPAKYLDPATGFNIKQTAQHLSQENPFIVEMTYKPSGKVQSESWHTKCGYETNRTTGFDEIICDSRQNNLMIVTHGDFTKSVLFMDAFQGADKFKTKVNLKLDGGNVMAGIPADLLGDNQTDIILRKLKGGKELIYTWKKANGQFEKVKIDLYGLKESLEFVDALKTANR